MQIGGTLDDWVKGQLAVMARKAGVKVPSLGLIDSGPPLMARVNHNRWIVDCPDCGGAEFVWPDKLLFLCVNCWNGVVGHMWRGVVLPGNKAEIDAVLMARPVPANRNWEVGETLKALEAENAKRGLPKRWRALSHEGV